MAIQYNANAAMKGVVSMPDLSPSASHRFWFEYNDHAIYKAIGFLESVENWTLENTENMPESLKKLGQALETIGQLEFANESLFVKAGAYLKSSQILRILQAIDVAHPGAASKVLVYAEENMGEDDDPRMRFFIQRNIAFERLRLLSRVFSHDRMKLAIDALDDEKS